MLITDDFSTYKGVVTALKRNLIYVCHIHQPHYGRIFIDKIEVMEKEIITTHMPTIKYIIFTMDSDGQHKPENIEKMIKPILLDKADIVIGSRYLEECHYKVPFTVELKNIALKFVI